VGLRRLSVVTAIVILGALVLTPGAQACSCAHMAPAEAMRQADAAIVGKLVKVVPRGRVKADYRYRVQRVYKRGGGIRRGRVIAVRSARQSAACGLPHGIGRAFGLMLSRNGRRWTGGLCGVFRPRHLHSARSFYRCDS
jgi:hypothetical protein